MITLKQELVIEDANGGISVIPKDTKLKLVKENIEQLNQEEYDAFNAFNEVLSQFIPDKLVVVKNDLKEGVEDVEGAQTDVDDFDVHKVSVVYGRVIFEVAIPKESIPIRFTAADTLNESSQLVRFVLSADIPSFDDIEETLAEKANVALWGKRNHKNDESKVSAIISKKTTDDVLVIDIIWDISISESIGRESLVHKGRYRTGGRYPDA